jgi:hypothetical protein
MKNKLSQLGEKASFYKKKKNNWKNQSKAVNIGNIKLPKISTVNDNHRHGANAEAIIEIEYVRISYDGT